MLVIRVKWELGNPLEGLAATTRQDMGQRSG